MEELLAADFPDCDDESSSSSEDVLEDSSDQDQFDNNEETGSSEPRVHDIGIQCCCQPVTLRSVAVQTEDSKPKKNKANVTPTPIQNEPYMYIPPCVDAVQWKVLKDHTYSLAYPHALLGRAMPSFYGLAGTCGNSRLLPSFLGNCGSQVQRS